MTAKPILIVGAGPTGLMVALELARRGVAFRLVDRSPEPAHWSAAIFIKPRTLEILSGLGLKDAFYEHGQIVEGVSIYSDATPMAAYAFGGLDSPFPHILSIPEEETINILTRALEAHGGSVERGVEFVALEEEASGLSVQLKSAERGAFRLEASWVVGADGYRSAVRRAVDDAFEGADYPELWGVVDTHLSNWQHARETVCAQLQAPIVIPFPLGEERWRVYFRPQDGAKGDVLADVTERLAVVSPGVALKDPGTPQFFHSHSRLARNYRVGRVFLAGDAAHASNPIEGHGMNAGIQDAYNLGWKLAAIASGRGSEDLIDSYEAERRPVDQAIVQSGDEAYRRMAPQGAEALKGLFAFLSEPEGQEFAALAESEITHGYADSPIVQAIGVAPSPSERATRAGHRVGEVPHLAAATRTLSLHELIAHPGATALVLPGATDDDGHDAALSLVQRLEAAGLPGLKVFAVHSGASVPPSNGTGLLVDRSGLLHERLGGARPTLCVIRPDGHLGFCCSPPSLDSLLTHLRVSGLAG